MAITDRVRELVSSVVTDSGAQLYDIEFNGGVLRILVDADDGIDIATIKTISRAAGRILDESDPIPGRYTLEVSSPGLERPLRTRVHFERAVGKLAKIKTQAEVGGVRRFVGTIGTADTSGVDLVVDGETQRISYDQIAKARTVFEWGPAPKPGGKNSSKNRPNKEANPS